MRTNLSYQEASGMRVYGFIRSLWQYCFIDDLPCESLPTGNSLGKSELLFLKGVSGVRATKGTQVISTNRRHQTQQGMPVTHSPQTVRAFYIQSLFILILCGRMCSVDVWFGLIYKIFPGFFSQNRKFCSKVRVS